MTGTLVNAASIVLGGCIGLLLKKGIKDSFQDSIHKALGIAVIVLGLNGVITNMICVTDGKLSSSGELLLVISLVLGTVLGETLRIDSRLDSLSGRLEKKFGLSGFSASFMNGTLIYCVGAMAIIGAMNDGLTGDSTTLFIKSILDGITSIILSATLGMGVIFSALPVFLYQGSITLLAGFVQPFLTELLLHQICAVGYVLVICIGINFLGITRIKTANLLPSLLIPLIYQGILAIIRLNA